MKLHNHLRLWSFFFGGSFDKRLKSAHFQYFTVKNGMEGRDYLNTSIAEHNCLYCAHAAVCPNRDIFMQFYENRDKVMVKCGNDDGSVDTSKQLSIRVEHRYLDGPALDQIYRDLNLGQTGFLPCLAAYGNCCPIKQPFDSPIYGRYPRAIGYIDNICNVARDAAGNRIPFVAPPAPARTNEVHASPFTTTYPGLANQQWNCGGCAYAEQCITNFDPNKLGGTPFSTFAVTYLDVNAGDIISIDSIPIPDNLMAYYERSDGDCNQPTYEIKDETTTIIIYYSYAGKPPMPVPSFDTLDKLKEMGEIHSVNFFYGPRSYVYPSLSNATIVPMRTIMLGVVAGVGRVDESGKVLASPGQIVPFRQNGKGILKLDYDNAYTDGNTASFTNFKQTVDVSSVDFQTCDEIVEGDKILLSMTFDKKWLLDTKMMHILNFGSLVNYQNSQYLNGNFVVNYLTADIGTKDLTIQTCLSDRTKVQDAANYPVIDYEEYWDPTEVHWGKMPVATIQGDQIVMVDQPIPPRKWSKFVVTDNMPFYATDCPPDDTCIVRPNFSLLGYTDNVEDRQSFNSDMPIFSAEEMEYDILQTNDGLDLQANNGDVLSGHKEPTMIYKNAHGRLYQEKSSDSDDLIISQTRFLESGPNGDNVAWGIWELDFDSITKYVSDASKDFLTPTDQSGCFIKVADLTENPNEGEDAETMLSTLDPISLSTTLEYQPAQALALVKALKGLAPDKFKATLYRIPRYAMSITLWNTWPEDEMSTEHEPHGTFQCVDGAEVQLSEMRVYEDSAKEDWMKMDDLYAEYILIIQPEKVYGMSSLYQNYVAYHLFVTSVRVKTTPTLIFDGSKVSFGTCKLNMSALRGYELSNLYPEDAGQVILNTESMPIMELTGDRAKFYELSNAPITRCEQHISYNAVYNNLRDNDISMEYSVATGSQMTIPISPENPKHSVISVVFKSSSGELVTLYSVENGEVSIHTMNEPGKTQGYTTVDEHGKITLYLFDIKEDGEILVVLHNGDDGSVAGCSRCRGYVDASKYDFIQWVPYCTDFTSAT